MPSTQRGAAGLTAIVAGGDQLAKVVVRHFLLPCARGPAGNCDRLVLVRNLMLLNVRNRGSALGYRQGVWVWTVVAVAGLAVIALAGRRARSREALAAVALLAGGAIGNLLDRIIAGGVTDFICLRWGRHGGIVINVADIALGMGAYLAGPIIVRKAALHISAVGSRAPHRANEP